MNKKERAKIVKLLESVKSISCDMRVDIKVDIVLEIVKIDEDIHKYKADIINKTRASGTLNEFGRGNK